MKKETSGRKPVVKKTPAQQKAAQVQKAIKAVQKRANVTAREARDIVTEIGTIANYNASAAFRGISKKEQKDMALKEGKTFYKDEKGRTARYYKMGMRKDGTFETVKNPRNPAAKSGAKSLATQINEVGTAAKTGKPGTSASVIRKDLGSSSGNVSRSARSNVAKNNRMKTYKSMGPKGR